MTDLIVQAFDLMDQGKSQEALRLLDDLAERIDPDSPDYAFYLNTRGYCYCELGEYEAARLVYKDLLARAKISEERHVAYHQLAMAERLAGAYDTAMSYLVKEAEVISAAFPHDPLKRSVNAYERAYVTFCSGRAQEALPLMEEALEGSLETDDLICQACAYRGLGEIRGDSLFFQKAKDLFLEAGDVRGAEEVEQLLLKYKDKE